MGQLDHEGITPEALLLLDAPTQRWKYGVPSVTSPKDLQAQMYDSARISGQHDGRSKGDSWSFPSPDFVLPTSNPQYSPSITPSVPSTAVFHAPSRPPQPVTSSSLVDRPQRKRGKLPKETTDYLKAWLHRHSDHPYPSEEEKKQLCHATGLSMSQISNWMINVSHNLRITPKSC